jgi:hypothetical protein
LTYTNKILPGSNHPAPEVCKSRSLGSKANTPGADEEEKSVDGEDDETGQGQMMISPDVGGTSEDRTRIKRGKSDYQRTREANIAKNQKLLEDLGLLFNSVDETDKGGKKKGNKGKKKEKSKVLMAPMRSPTIGR